MRRGREGGREKSDSVLITNAGVEGRLVGIGEGCWGSLGGKILRKNYTSLSSLTPFLGTRYVSVEFGVEVAPLT